MGNWIKRNFFFFFFGIFAFVGSILGLVAGVLWFGEIDIQNKGERSEGRVVDMLYSDGAQAPVVEFPLGDGSIHQYSSNLYSSPPSYEVGEMVELWYDPNNPDRVSMAGMDSWFAPVILGVFFLVFGGIGYGGLIYQILKWRDVVKLKRSGTAVEAKLAGIYQNGSVTMNGKHPWVIKCEWKDSLSNKTYTYISEHIWYDPTDYVQGDTMRVLIDPNDPGMYYVDTAFLPEK